METAAVIVNGANDDLSTRWREFHGIVDQIPKDLLKPDAISQDEMFFGVELGQQV